MNIAVISFTKAGSRVCVRLMHGFREMGESCIGYVKSEFAEEEGVCRFQNSLGAWTEQMFARMDVLIYVGAAGIAVRAIAPFLKDKMTDPAVLVCDEQGQFVISLLSGHVGGANEWTRKAAKILGAVPVITTASDVQGILAVDVWAKQQKFMIADRNLAKRMAAALVSGQRLGFFNDLSKKIELPEEFLNETVCRENLWVTWKAPADFFRAFCMRSGWEKCEERVEVLRLIPKVLTVGIGCRKQTKEDVIRQAVEQVCSENELDLRAVCRFASIDLKKEEPGIRLFAEELNVPFVTFSSEELKQAAGSFSDSEFVEKTTGVGNVCERSALLGAGFGAVLLVKKVVKNGVTVAVACQEMEG